MSGLYRLTDAQMAKLSTFFPKSHGKPRVDDRRVLSGIIFSNRNGLRWRDAPKAYGPHKPLYSRWRRWSEKSAFLNRPSIMQGLFQSIENKVCLGRCAGDVPWAARATMLRGNRYQVLVGEFYRYVLMPHDDALKEVYGVRSSDIADGFQATAWPLRSLSFGEDTRRAPAQYPEIRKEGRKIAEKPALRLRTERRQAIDHVNVTSPISR